MEMKLLSGRRRKEDEDEFGREGEGTLALGRLLMAFFGQFALRGSWGQSGQIRIVEANRGDKQ
jgi:hypothetical protein